MNHTTFDFDIAKKREASAMGGQSDRWGGSVHAQTCPDGVFFLRQQPGMVVHEACGSADYWGRALSAPGHEVRLIHACHLTHYVRGNKNDAADAQAIRAAAQQPERRWVSLKSEEQQAVLSLHRVRSRWVKVRTRTVNALRGLLDEFGVARLALGGSEKDTYPPG